MAPQITKPPNIVGILNVTPDSFSDGGLFLDPKTAIDRAFQLREEGADFVEVGGESTRPGSEPIPLDEEWRRIEPVLKVIVREIPTAVDTYRAAIAERALALGASLINDVSGLRADPEMARVVARGNARLVIMHSKEPGSRPHASEISRKYRELLPEVGEFLLRQARSAEELGVKRDNIILDPGLGKFLSLDPEDSWQLLSQMKQLTTLGYPILLGASRKGFLGQDNVDSISALLSVFGALQGISYVRVHNVKMTHQFLSTWTKLTRERIVEV